MQARQEQVGRDGEKRHGRDLLSGWISPCLKDASWRLARWVARDLVLVLTKTGVSTLGASAEELRGGTKTAEFWQELQNDLLCEIQRNP
jgi:hypothetical protein